jgi:hypothetical protein
MTLLQIRQWIVTLAKGLGKIVDGDPLANSSVALTAIL